MSSDVEDEHLLHLLLPRRLVVQDVHHLPVPLRVLNAPGSLHQAIQGFSCVRRASNSFRFLSSFEKGGLKWLITDCCSGSRRPSK